MNYLKICAIALAMLASPALAQTAAPAAATPAAAALDLHPGYVVVSSDGHRVGELDRVNGPKDAPVSISVVTDTAIVTIPVSTLSAGSSKGMLVTSLTYRKIQ